MEIENKLAVNDIAYTFEDNQIKEHIVRIIKVFINEEGQEIKYLLTDNRWHADNECFLNVEDIFQFLKDNINNNETTPF